MVSLRESVISLQMNFFDSLAQSIIDIVKSVWGVMKHIAAVLINNTFGAFTGKEMSEDMAGLILWGGLGGVLLLILIAWKGFSFEGKR